MSPTNTLRNGVNRGLGGEDELPSPVIASIENFRRDMILAQANLKNRKIGLGETTLLVASGCEKMKDILTRHVIDEPSAGKTVGALVFREAFPFLMSSALVERSYMKPRGYAGDFETIEMIYKSQPTGAGAFGRMIDAWALATGASNAVRSRRTKLLGDVQAFLAQSEAPEFAIASLALGPGREIFDIFETEAGARVRVTGIDLDSGALAFCAEEARKRSLGEDRLKLYQDNLIRLSLGRGRVQIPKQNFIYSMGLIDYLPKGLVVKLMDWAYDQLLVGGTLAFGNFASGNRERPYMDYVLNWILIHRTSDEMRELFRRSKFGNSEARIDADASGIQLFAYCTKT
jgi:extracellular factor (EF) 3-hydroxypalmitic acid methyl ester biosynthesis protein